MEETQAVAEELGMGAGENGQVNAQTMLFAFNLKMISTNSTVASPDCDCMQQQSEDG